MAWSFIDLGAIAALYATVNSDDWTWLPILYMSFLRRHGAVFCGYVAASAIIFSCLTLATLSDRFDVLSQVGSLDLPPIVGMVFVAVGLWRGWQAFRHQGQQDDETVSAGRWQRYPLVATALTVFANGYNNVLVLVPVFKSLDGGHSISYALTLPVFNLMFAGILLLMMNKFQRQTLNFTKKYAAPAGAVAMVLLGLKFILQQPG